MEQNGKYINTLVQQTMVTEALRFLVFFGVLLWAMGSTSTRIRNLEKTVESLRSRTATIEGAVITKQ